MSAAAVAFWLVAGGGALARWMSVVQAGRTLSARWRLAPSPDARSDTRVSVVVPARDEAAVIDRLLTSLDAQDHPHLEVVVCDDRSTDDTGARARTHRCRVVEGSEPPPGWLGKPWAITTAAEATTGDVLCFVDADTWHDPAAIRTCVAFMEREGADVLVVVSGHHLGSWPERWVMPFFWAAMLGFIDVERADDPKRPDDAMGNGQFWLVRREAWAKIGGHGAVRAKLAEDVAIVRALKAAGARARLRFGPDLTRTRMYTCFAQLWRGFEKNAAVVDPAQPKLSAALTVLAMALLVQAELWPWLVAALAPTVGGLWAHPAALGLAAAQLLALWVGRAQVLGALCDDASGVRLSRHPLTFLGQPVGALLGLLAIANSLQAQLRGTTRWKGRRVAGTSL